MNGAYCVRCKSKTGDRSPHTKNTRNRREMIYCPVPDVVPLNVNSFLVTTKGVKNPKGLNLGDLLPFYNFESIIYSSF